MSANQWFGERIEVEASNDGFDDCPDSVSQANPDSHYDYHEAQGLLAAAAAAAPAPASAAAPEASPTTAAASSASCSLREEADGNGFWPLTFENMDHSNSMGSSVCLNNLEHLFLEAMGYEA